MAIELLAIDMDGTLLNPAHEITPRVAAAVAAARARGVHVVLATGRPFLGVRRYLAQLELARADVHCITCNGALVQQADTGSSLMASTLGFDDYLHVEALARELGVHFQAMDEAHLYTPNADISEFTVREAFLSSVPLRYRTVAQMDRSLRFSKIMMVDEPTLLDHAIARIPEPTRQRYTIVKSATHFLEILHPHADKGKSLHRLADRLGVARENVMAIGDQQNDLAMVEYAGVGVAMGNAIPAVQASADYVTASNAEDGVAQAIERFVLDDCAVA